MRSTCKAMNIQKLAYFVLSEAKWVKFRITCHATLVCPHSIDGCQNLSSSPPSSTTFILLLVYPVSTAARAKLIAFGFRNKLQSKLPPVHRVYGLGGKQPLPSVRLPEKVSREAVKFVSIFYAFGTQPPLSHYHRTCRQHSGWPGVWNPVASDGARSFGTAFHSRRGRWFKVPTEALKPSRKSSLNLLDTFQTVWTLSGCIRGGHNRFLRNVRIHEMEFELVKLGMSK